MSGPNQLLRFFRSDHLPEDLRDTARAFENLAHAVDQQLMDSAEKSVCLRKLLEAKDAAVRVAVLMKEQRDLNSDEALQALREKLSRNPSPPTAIFLSEEVIKTGDPHPGCRCPLCVERRR